MHSLPRLHPYYQTTTFFLSYSLYTLSSAMVNIHGLGSLLLPLISISHLPVSHQSTPSIEIRTMDATFLAPTSPRFPPSAPLALCQSLVQTVGCVGLEMAVIFVLARLNLLYKWDDCQYVALYKMLTLLCRPWGRREWSNVRLFPPFPTPH